MTAMSLVIAAWIPLFFIFTGVGLAAAHAVRFRPQHAQGWFRCFWIGWALVLVFLQIWHLAFRVDWRPLLVVSAIGAAGLFLHRRELWNLVWRVAPRNWLFCFVVLVLTLRIANRAIGAPMHTDAGFYHLSSIRWAATFPIVPGLGNLHHPFAINSAHFLYVALLDIGLWAGRSYHVANGLLLLTACAQVIACIFAMCRRNGGPRVSDVFLALALPALLTQAAVDRSLYNALFVHLVCSPTPDLPVFVLGLLLARELLVLIESESFSGSRSGFLLVSIAALCIAGVMVKLSFAVLSATALGVASLVWVSRAARSRAEFRAGPLAFAVAIVVMGIVPWVVRSVTLSGYVAYPSPAVSFAVDWRMPKETVAAEAEFVRRHARWPSTVIANRARLRAQSGPPHWLATWFAAIYRVGFWTVVVPCALTLVACCMALYWRVTGGYARQLPRVFLLLFVPLICSAVFWFFAAPSPRFAGSVFWAVGAGALALGVSGLPTAKRTTASYVLVALSVVLSLYLFSRMTLRGPGQDDGFHPAPQVTMTTYVTRSGLRILVPANKRAGQLSYCWDAPLPCTPRPDLALRLRKRGHIEGGFTVDVAPRGGSASAER